MSSLREQRRYEIIEAAMKVFGEHGFYQGKVGEIAKEAGIGKGTVYEYFGSKKEIFQQMLMYMFETYVEGGKKAVIGEKAIRDKLIVLLDYHYAFVNQYADVIERTFFHFENIVKDIKPEIAQNKRKIFDFVLEIITEGIETGELRSNLDKETASIIILGIVNSSHLKRIFIKADSINKIDSRAVIDMVLLGMGR
ncbi:MAG: TetR/AcrR family transcriptional regulator [Tissierellia bacterium]|nr:TetR/AcrR family transcriptional regulator [Tissierellia bacterium]